MKKISLLLMLFVGIISTSSVVSASVITLDSNYQGWVNSAGDADGGYDGNNTFTGNEFGERYNSWANFDLSGVSGVVTSAILELTTSVYPDTSGESYEVGVYDVSTGLGDLLSNSGGVTAYNDFRNGSLYASNTFSNNTTIQLILSVQALSDINFGLGGDFLFGFTNLTLNQVVSGLNDDFGIYTNENSPKLILNTADVPEPSILALFGLGLMSFGFSRKKKKAA